MKILTLKGWIWAGYSQNKLWSRIGTSKRFSAPKTRYNWYNYPYCDASSRLVWLSHHRATDRARTIAQPETCMFAGETNLHFIMNVYFYLIISFSNHPSFWNRAMPGPTVGRNNGIDRLGPSAEAILFQVICLPNVIYIIWKVILKIFQSPWTPLPANEQRGGPGQKS